MDSYKRFVRVYGDLVDLHDGKLKKELDEKSYKKSILFVSDIYKSLEQSKVFEVTDEVKKLLLLTDAPKDDDIKLPFPHIFIDCHLSREEIQKFSPKTKSHAIHGILVREGELRSSKDDKVIGKGLRITVCHEKDYKGNLYANISTFNTGDTQKPLGFVYGENGNVTRDDVHSHLGSGTEKLAVNFVKCFLHFLTDPEVKVIKVHRGKKNTQRRIRQGKRPLPTSYKVTINGYLKEYVDKLNSGGKFSYSHRFWVRGHFRTLRHPRYKEKRGTRIWIKPFIKGEGILIDKTYEVKREDDEE